MDDRELDMIIRLAYKDKTITQRHKKEIPCGVFKHTHSPSKDLLVGGRAQRDEGIFKLHW